MCRNLLFVASMGARKTMSMYVCRYLSGQIKTWNNSSRCEALSATHSIMTSKGIFHVERRLGCIGCPLRSDKGKADFFKRPKFLKRLIQCATIWWVNNPHNASHSKFANVYELVWHDLFCNSYGDYIKAKQTDLFGEELDCKKYLEEYFKIEL